MPPVIPKYHYSILQALATAGTRERRRLLKSVSPALIRTLAQIAANVLHGNIRLTPVQKKQLGRYKKTLRALKHKYTNVERKRKQLIQHGGFLPLLLPLITGVVGGLINRAISKK